MTITNRINAIVVGVDIRSNSKLAVRIDYSIFGEYKKKSRYYTFEDAQRFITRTKLYDFGLLIGHGIWADPTYTIKENGQFRGIDALHCSYIDVYHNMDIYFKDGSMHHSKLTIMEARDLFWTLNDKYEDALKESVSKMNYDTDESQIDRDYNNSGQSEYLSRYKWSIYDMGDDWDYEEFPPENIW